MADGVGEGYNDDQHRTRNDDKNGMSSEMDIETPSTDNSPLSSASFEPKSSESKLEESDVTTEVAAVRRSQRKSTSKRKKFKSKRKKSNGKNQM